MKKVIDRRLLQAAELSQQQQNAPDMSHAMRLQEEREKLTASVMADMNKIKELCGPWTFVAPALEPAQ